MGVTSQKCEEMKLKQNLQVFSGQTRMMMQKQKTTFVERLLGGERRRPYQRGAAGKLFIMLTVATGMPVRGAPFRLAQKAFGERNQVCPMGILGFFPG